MTFIEQLQQRGIPFKTSYSDSNEITLRCPFCNDDQFRLGVNLQTGFGNCFHGQCTFKSRRAVAILAKKLEMGELTAYYGAVKEEEEPVTVSLPRDFQLLSKKDDDPLIRKARSYLFKRGVNKRQIKEKGIGISLVGKFAYRIVFPVMDHDDLVYLVGRDFTGSQEPKYLNSPGPKAVYNVPGGNHRRSIILSEGIFKCLAIEEKLSVPSGALLGHTLTDRQLDMLDGFKGFALWPDPDIVGLSGFMKLAVRLSSKHKVWLPEVIPTKQADVMSDLEIAAVFDSFKLWSSSLESKYRRRVLALAYEP